MIPTTLHETLAALGQQQFSATELVQTLLSRLEQTEPVLHNYVRIFEKDALARAARVDQHRANGDTLPALAGVPLGVKDIFDVSGSPTKCNSRLREHAAPATSDSDAVASLRRDGAIILGKTVTQEFAAGVISPPARNPWDPDRIPGGSSGGSAASVAAGTSLGALGSDTGGSIRIPASVNGVAGLKPTWNRLSTRGVFPLSSSLDTVGPIAPSVLDCAVLYLSLVNRPEQISPLIAQFNQQDLSLTGTRFGVFTNHFNERLQPGVAAAFAAAVAHVRQLGAEIIEIEWPEAAAARAAALLISRVESTAVHYDNLREHPDLMGEDLRARLEAGSFVPAAEYLRSRLVRKSVTSAIARLFAAHRLDATLSPTLPATAPRVDEPFITFPDGTEEPVAPALVRYTTPFNATGQPVVSLPCGFDERNLPVGLSITGKPDHDLDLCHLAHIYEQTTAWHQQRPEISMSS